MRRESRFLSLILTIVLGISIVSYTSAAQQRTAESLSGVWIGYYTDVPAVEFTLKTQAGKAVGTVIFYKVIEGEVKGKIEAPLIDPVFDGRILTFKVKEENGSFYKGKIKFIAEDEAFLSSDDENPADGISLTLRRKK